MLKNPDKNVWGGSSPNLCLFAFVTRLSDQATLELETLGSLLQMVSLTDAPDVHQCTFQVRWLPALWAPLYAMENRGCLTLSCRLLFGRNNASLGSIFLHGWLQKTNFRPR
jgi:hypothetical protein